MDSCRENDNVFVNQDMIASIVEPIYPQTVGRCSAVINIGNKERKILQTQWEKHNQVVPPRQLIGITISKSTTNSTTVFSPNVSFHDKLKCQNIVSFPFEDVGKRLFSYGHWPKDAKIWPPELAQAGFFYLGDKFKVQCSTCGIQSNIGDWECRDNALDVHVKLNPNCEFLKTISYSLNRRKQQTNNSLDNKSRRERELLTIADDEGDSPASFSNKQKLEPVRSLATKMQLSPPEGVVFKYPQYSTEGVRMKSFGPWRFGDIQNPKRLAECGYFYTGEADIVRCFCCDLGLAEWDTSDDPWLEHARHSTKCWFLIERKGKTYVEQVQSDWKRVYNPKHPAFEDKVARRATFDGVWRTDIEQTADILADAGFFYEGEEDVVRCHYCDGGLRHWEPEDTPWEEHARWFPFCKFVIKMKGRDYIDAIKVKHEDQSREDLRTQTTDVTSQTNQAPVIKFILEMGFSLTDATYAANKYTTDKGNSNYNAEDLLNILIQKHEDDKIQHGLTAMVSNRQVENEHDTEVILKKNRELKKNMLCLKCKGKERCILFVNCGHRVTCETCGYQVDNCPYCGTKIKKRLKTFLS